MADKNKPENHDDEEIIPFKEEGEIEIPDLEGETTIQPIERVEEPEKEPDSFEEINMPGGPDNVAPQEEEISTELVDEGHDFESDVQDSDVRKSLEEPSKAPKTQFAGSMEEEVHGSEETPVEEEVHGSDESPVEEEVEASEPDTASSPDPELPLAESKKTQLASSQAKHTMFQSAGEIGDTPAEESGLIENGADQELEGTNTVEVQPVGPEGEEGNQDNQEVQSEDQESGESQFSEYQQSEEVEETPVEEEAQVEAQDATSGMESPDYASQKPVKGPSRFVWSMVGLFLGVLIPTGLYLGGIEIPQKYRFVEGPEFGELKTKYSKAEQTIKDKDGKISELDKQIADNKDKHEEDKKLAVAAKQKELDDLQKVFDSAKAQHKKDLEQKDILIAKEKEDGDKRVSKAVDDGKKNLADATTKYEKEKKDLMASFKKQEDDYIAKIAVLNSDVKRVEGERDKSNNLIKSVGDLLVKETLSKNPSDPNEVYEGVKKGMKIVQDKDPQGTMRGQAVTIKKQEDNLTANKQNLDLVTLPNPKGPSASGETRKKGVESANKILSNTNTSNGDKGRANIYLGEELLAKKDYASAKAKLQEGKGGLDPNDKEWSSRADESLKIASDPVGHYLNLAKDKAPADQINDLNSAEEAARKVAPEKVTDVLVQRANSNLEIAYIKGKGAVSPTDPNMGNAIKDSDEAVKGGKASSFLIKVKVEVALAKAYWEMNQSANARKSKTAAVDFARKAIAADRSVESKIKEELSDLDNISQLPEETQFLSEGLESLLIRFVTAIYYQPISDAVPPTVSAQDLKKADDILKKYYGNEGPKPSAVDVVWALKTKGYYAKALEVFIKDLWSKTGKALDSDTVKNLERLQTKNPNLSNTDFKGPNTHEFGEQCFGEGVNFFFNRKYEEAEKALNRAIQAYNDDARYHYFLALSMHAQGKITAADSFGRAANLERNGRPNRSAVSTSLERVQGSIRSELNKYRNAGLAPRP